MERSVEFLKVAGTWMACRWLVMGHEIEPAVEEWNGGLEGFLLGMHDQAHEMRLILEEKSYKLVL